MENQTQESFWNMCLMSSEGRLLDYRVENPALAYNPSEGMMRFGSMVDGEFKLLIGFGYNVPHGEESDFLCNSALRSEREKAPRFLRENLLTIIQTE